MKQKINDNDKKMKKFNKGIVPNNSFSEFLLYKTPNGNVTVEVFVHDENLWLTQKRMAELYDVDRSVITKHLTNIFLMKNLKKNQYVQILHILPRMVKIIRQNFIILMQ